MSSAPNIVVLVSGRGRSLENLLAHQARDGGYVIAGVVSSNPSAAALGLAQAAAIPAEAIDFSDAEAAAARLRQLDEQHHPELYVLAGFTRKLPLPRWLQGRVINIHPSLLPDFGGEGMYGMRVHRAVVAAGRGFSGATVHWVGAGYDDGPVIAQLQVSVLGITDPAAVAARVFEAEKVLLPFAIRSVLQWSGEAGAAE